jgi:hypothetical protein
VKQDVPPLKKKTTESNYCQYQIKSLLCLRIITKISGLELGIARELARNGPTVIITYMNKSELKKACNLMKIVIEFN